jgi:F-type H+-transporting ATPase subunit epsilon
MHKTFRLQIVGPEKTLFDSQVVSLVLPTTIGYLGVLADHAPLMVSVGSGKLSARDASGKETTMSLSSVGVMEVLNNNALIVLPSAPQS